MARLEPGTEVGTWRIERRLGGGGFANVYLAMHRVLHAPYALKVLTDELVSDEQVRDRFLAEGRILAQLRHPNLVRVTDLVSEPGIAALVMEYVDGPTLEDWIAERPNGATPAEAAAVLGPILDAIGHAHQRGIVHRDLKPANVLLASDHRGGLFPVVIDFGVAHLQRGARVTGGRMAATQTGMRMGTPSYMSPEQVRGGSVDARSDLFSIGVLAYEIATGQRPFDRSNDFDTMRAVCDGAWSSARLVRPALPAWFDELFKRALAVNPADRFESCEAMAQALAPWWTAPSADATTSSSPLPKSIAPPPGSTAAAPPRGAEPPGADRPRPPDALEPEAWVRARPSSHAAPPIPIPEPPDPTPLVPPSTSPAGSTDGTTVPARPPKVKRRPRSESWTLGQVLRTLLALSGGVVGGLAGTASGSATIVIPAMAAGIVVGWFAFEFMLIGLGLAIILAVLGGLLLAAWVLLYDPVNGWFGG